MSFILARYNGEIGRVLHLPNSTKIGFKTNSSYYQLLEEVLESGKHIIPVPFYGVWELKIINQKANSSFRVKYLFPQGNLTREIFLLDMREINWFLIDASKWSHQRRTYINQKYGLNNFKITIYERNY